MVINYQESAEDRADAAYEQLIRDIAQGLGNSLHEHEEYFFQEIIKNLRLDGQDSSRKIDKTIDDVLINDPNKYIQNIDIYKKYTHVVGTQNDAKNLYIDELRKKLVGTLSRDEVNNVVVHYLGFLQRKEELFEEGKLSETNTDIENFIDIQKKTIQDEFKLEQIRKFLEKLGTCMEVERTYTKNDLIQGLNNTKNDLSSEQRGEVQDIEKILQKQVGKIDYQKFILNFFKKTEKLPIRSITEIENITEELMKEYSIMEDKLDMTNHLLRLKNLIYKIY